MAEVVADSSCLIHLDRIGQLGLLEPLFGAIITPEAVAREVGTASLGLPAWVRIQALAQPVPRAVAARSLGPGEIEAIALELQSARLILDDRVAASANKEKLLRMRGSLPGG